MQQKEVHFSAIKLVGLKTAFTNNATEMSDWQNGKIYPCVVRYFHEKLAETIQNRKKPGTTFCVYRDYESDHTGEYVYFIGEEVTSFDGVPAGLDTYTVPAQTYAKFTTDPDMMPAVLKDAWNLIFTLSDRELGGKRAYLADFEVYDERAADHSKPIVLDIYIGIVPHQGCCS